MRFDHVIFDLDGTLIDSLLDLSAATNYTLRHLRLAELPASTVRDYVGEGARQLLRRAIGVAGAARFDEALALFLDYYGAHLLDHTQLYPGVLELLDSLAGRDVMMTILTNKPIAMTTAILDGLGIAARFAHVLGADSLSTRKPDPAGVEWLLQHTGATRTQTLLVGDSLVDSDTAQAADIAFCGVDWGFGSAQLRAAGVQPIIATPQQLMDEIRRWRA